MPNLRLLPDLAAIAVLAVGAAACASFHPFQQKAPLACYWLSNEGQGWVQRDDLETKQACFQMNSCGPGGGESGGGCYKWAPDKDASGVKW